MQLALTEAARARGQRSVARETARIVRPWAFLVLGGVFYMGYALQDSLSVSPQQAAPLREATAPSTPAAPPAPAARLRMVTKCVEPAGTSYSDQGCAPEAVQERIALVADAPAAAPAVAGAPDRVCRDLEQQVRRIDLKASLAPSDADHAWLEARRQEARREQARLGC